MPAKESPLSYQCLITTSQSASCLQAAPMFILLTDLPGPQPEQRLSMAQKLMQAVSLFHLSHHTAGHVTQVAFLPELHFQQVGCLSMQGPMEPGLSFLAAAPPFTTRQHAALPGTKGTACICNTRGMNNQGPCCASLAGAPHCQRGLSFGAHVPCKLCGA